MIVPKNTSPPGDGVAEAFAEAAMLAALSGELYTPEALAELVAAEARVLAEAVVMSSAEVQREIRGHIRGIQDEKHKEEIVDEIDHTIKVCEEHLRKTGVGRHIGMHALAGAAIVGGTGIISGVGAAGAPGGAVIGTAVGLCRFLLVRGDREEARRLIAALKELRSEARAWRSNRERDDGDHEHR